MIHKVADLKAGEYGKDIALSPVMCRRLGMELPEKLLADKSLPNGCWMVDVRVEVTFGIRGTADDMRKGGDWVSVSWSLPVEKDVELRSKSVPVTGAKVDVLVNPPVDGPGGG